MYLQVFWNLGLGLQCQIDNPNPNKKTKRIPNPNCLLGGECCATAVLSAQEDFKSTRSRLQEIVEDAGHIFILYPKFHCELNWIEYYWGRRKYFARKHCNYSLSGKGPEFSTCTWSDRPSCGNLLTIPGFRIARSCSLGS